MALLGLVALGWTAGRIAGLADTVDTEATQLIITLDRTADALHDAGTSATAFATTLERTPPSVRQAAQTIRDLQPSLETIGVQLESINILGTQPLAGPAQLFTAMAADLEGLDARIDLIADDLETDRAVLLVNADSLRDLGDRTTVLADRVRTGFIQGGLDDLRAVLILTILVSVGWTAVPAVGALTLGVWLRRTLGVDEPG
jgi:hypothetical protein